MILTTVVIFLAIFGVGAGIEETVLAWGNGMWALLEIGMQFTILMVAAHACVSSRPVFRLLDRPASLPDPERPVQAVVLVGAYSLITAYLNWAFCLVASAIFIPFVARRNPNTDIRILITRWLPWTGHYLARRTFWFGSINSRHAGQSADSTIEWSGYYRPVTASNRDSLHPLQSLLLDYYQCCFTHDNCTTPPSEKYPNVDS